MTIDEMLQANPHAPHNDSEALQMARQLHVPKDTQMAKMVPLDEFASEEDEGIEDSCGESSLGILEATLASSLISEEARAEINTLISDSQPSLDQDKTIGHFRFHWTETSEDARDNVTESEIDATGEILNQWWTRFSTDFREPKADLVDGTRRIDIDVYYRDRLHGSTSSHSNRIFLRSTSVVSDDCRRLTTTAHELFHRVEYSYGYVTGTAKQKWWVEALGSWSQKYCNANQFDYLSRVNAGFLKPEKGLLTRSYDACHFWKWFSERLQQSDAFNHEHDAVREFMEEHRTNGNNAEIACRKIVEDMGGYPSFDAFFTHWSVSNHVKRLRDPNGSTDHRFGYADASATAINCHRSYGPMRNVPYTTDETITDDTFHWVSPSLSVREYASRYVNFMVESGVDQTRITIVASGNVSASLIQQDNSRWLNVDERLAVTTHNWDLDLSSQEVSRIVIAVSGLSGGGQFHIEVNP